MQVLLLMGSDWAMNKILNDPKNRDIRKNMYEPVMEEGFEAVWIIKEPDLGKPGSKVLVWFHGISLSPFWLPFLLVTKSSHLG